MTTIVIDPGHGGTAAIGSSTPFGVRGPRGTVEKDVTLLLARRLATRLGGQATLTRHADVNLSLGQRVETARRSGARVFLSLHANDGSGCETWVHPRSGASTRALAHRLHGALAPLTGGGSVRTGLMAVLDPHRLGGADACLIEVDRLGDLAGEARLSDGRTLDRIADALAGALRAHLGGSRYGRATPKLTAGEYSRALDDYLGVMVNDVGEETIRVNLLRRSPTFVAVVSRLDGRTIASGSDVYATLGLDDIVNGRVIRGPHIDKLIVECVAFVNLGHRFIPGTSPDAPWNANFVSIEGPAEPTGPNRGDFVEGFVHETLHLDAAVFARFPPAGTSLAQKIDAFFDEEISVRRQTRTIMNEITQGGPASLSGFVASTPPMSRPDVERDFPSGTDRLTYLETVVFEHLIADAIAAEGLTPSQVSDLITQANGESVGPQETVLLQEIGGFVLVFDPQQNLYVTPSSTALELMMRRRATSARWKLLFDAGVSAVDQEKAAQEHASLFFPPGIQYR